MPRYFRVQPYPDEEIGSLLTRTLRRVGLGTADFAHWYLNQPKAPLANIGNLVPHVAELIASTPRIVLQAHTLVPYGTAGLPANESRRLTIDLTSGRIPELSRPLGKLGRRWCATCLCRELAHFGESYWHRSHLLPGVCTCPLHGTVLLQLSGPAPTLPIHRAVTYWLGEALPHELAGTPVNMPIAPSLLHEISHWSARALKGRQALPAVPLSPADWREVLGPELLHYAGCRGSSPAPMAQTTARILSLIAQRRLEKARSGTQLEIFL